MLAGTDAGAGLRGHVGYGGILLFSPIVWARFRGGEGGGHTGTYTRMLHLPFSDLPLKSARWFGLPELLLTIAQAPSEGKKQLPVNGEK